MGERRSRIISPTQYLTIPPERVGVLIGDRGETKRRLEDATATRIIVDSSSGNITITARDGASPVDMLNAKRIVAAVGYGFAPNKAFLLSDDYNTLEVVELEYYIGTSQNDVSRAKARLIGERGKARKTIEDLSGAYLTIAEDVVAVLGTHERAQVAKNAVEMLLKGAPHAKAYRYLSRMSRELKKKELVLWEGGQLRSLNETMEG